MGETTNCPFCGEEILAVAKRCKHCGEWLDGSENGIRVDNVVKTERTAKQYKGIRLTGGLTAVLGVVLLMSGDPTATGAGMLMLGLLVFLIGRIGASWHHG